MLWEEFSYKKSFTCSLSLYLHVLFKFVFLSPLLLVHERHGALGLLAKNPREKLQGKAHVDGYEDVRGVDDHGDGREEDGVENGFFPRLQDIDAGNEQVLVVQPSQVFPEVLEVHPAEDAVLVEKN